MLWRWACTVFLTVSVSPKRPPGWLLHVECSMQARTTTALQANLQAPFMLEATHPSSIKPNRATRVQIFTSTSRKRA